MELCYLAGDTAPFILLSTLILGLLAITNFVGSNGGLEIIFTRPLVGLLVMLAATSWFMAFGFTIYRIVSSWHLIRNLLGLKPLPLGPEYFCLVDLTIIVSMATFGFLLVLMCMIIMWSFWDSKKSELPMMLINSNQGQH